MEKLTNVIAELEEQVHVPDYILEILETCPTDTLSSFINMSPSQCYFKFTFWTNDIKNTRKWIRMIEKIVKPEEFILTSKNRSKDGIYTVTLFERDVNQYIIIDTEESEDINDPDDYIVEVAVKL